MRTAPEDGVHVGLGSAGSPHTHAARTPAEHGAGEEAFVPELHLLKHLLVQGVEGSPIVRE